VTLVGIHPQEKSMTQSALATEPRISVLRDLLGVYDERFLDLAAEDRRRLVLGTRQVLGDDGLPPDVRAVLPSSYRLRAFCIQHELYEELDRLIRDELAGQVPGAVVVGGRVYAMYPYLRGVPRHDADITDEVVAVHRLDGLTFAGDKLRVRGRAAISQVEAREFTVDLALRQGQSERLIRATPDQDAFEVIVTPGDLPAGDWDVYIQVSTLGVTREAAFGAERHTALKPDPRERDGVRAYFADPDGTLAVTIPGEIRKPGLLRRLIRR
jgi:hypothetical protein